MRDQSANMLTNAQQRTAAQVSEASSPDASTSIGQIGCRLTREGASLASAMAPPDEFESSPVNLLIVLVVAEALIVMISLSRVFRHHKRPMKAPSFVTAKGSTIFVPVRVVAPMHPVEFAVVSVLGRLYR